MNILHMKYAVTVAELGSLNKAAEKLFVAPANLSRSIKQLEKELELTIFDRSAKGMALTPDGHDFVAYARRILNELDDIETKYKKGKAEKQRFSISVPRACYISYAFSLFSRYINAEECEVVYHETNLFKAVENILSLNYKLGIIRYASRYDGYFQQLLAEKGLASETIAEFRHKLVVGKDSPLATQEVITLEDLKDYVEITYGDSYMPSMPSGEAVQEPRLNHPKTITLFDRGSQFDVLQANPKAFMWVSAAPKRMLEWNHLVDRVCRDEMTEYKDVLIYKKGYKLSKLDKLFLQELQSAMKESSKE